MRTISPFKGHFVLKGIAFGSDFMVHSVHKVAGLVLRALGATLGVTLLVCRGCIGTNQVYRGYIRILYGIYQVVGIGGPSRGCFQSLWSFKGP